MRRKHFAEQAVVMLQYDTENGIRHGPTPGPLPPSSDAHHDT
nr:hypothetical protein [Kibdelosporangium sp. MJ126-NF4]CTQ91581.1 hypothetical protein [Kibdelosporangium sp. MJ126-NF4]